MQAGSFAFLAHGQPLEAVSEPVQAVMKRGKETLDWPHAGEKGKKKKEKQTQFSFRIKSAAHIAGKRGAPTHGCGAACSSPPGTLAPLVWGGWAAWCGQSEGTQGPRRCLASFGGTRSSCCPALGEALHSLPCRASPGTPHLAHTPRAGSMSCSSTGGCHPSPGGGPLLEMPFSFPRGSRHEEGARPQLPLRAARPHVLTRHHAPAASPSSITTMGSPAAARREPKCIRKTQPMKGTTAPVPMPLAQLQGAEDACPPLSIHALHHSHRMGAASISQVPQDTKLPRTLSPLRPHEHLPEA